MTSTVEHVPRFPASPTGHPSPDVAATINALGAGRSGERVTATIDAIAARPIHDPEDRVRQLRDLHHLAHAVHDRDLRAEIMKTWRIAVARATGEAHAGLSLRTIGDVCSLNQMAVRRHAEVGREHLDDTEGAALKLGVDQRRHRRLPT